MQFNRVPSSAGLNHPDLDQVFPLAQRLGAQFNRHGSSAVARGSRWMLKVHVPRKDGPSEGQLDLKLKSGWKSCKVAGERLARALSATLESDLLNIYKELR